MPVDPSSRPRGGMSTTELLACLLCVAGGLWIGANYLGVDLNRAAYVALDESDLISQIPQEWRPPNPDCPDGDCPDPADLRAAERAALDGQLDALRSEVARLRAGSATGDAAVAATILDDELADARDRTIAYWERLAEVIAEVDAIQQRVDTVTDPDEAAHVLVVRRKAFAYGQRAIGLLDAEGVDDRALETGARVARWFEQSENALSEAGEPAARQAQDGRTVSAESVWSQTQRQHSKQTELVRRKADDAFRYLNARYLVEFPPLSL